jgi:L-iditol 2-dehydrogenase
MAEYVAIPAMNLFLLPSNISFEVGAALEPLGVAMHAFEQSGFRPGDSVLILGPGPIGLGMLMIARSSGSSKVYMAGITLDRFRLSKAKDLGADGVFNSETENPGNRIFDDKRGRGVDIVFVCAGGEGVLMQAAKLIRKGGTVVVLGLFHGKTDFDPNLMVEKELIYKGSFRRPPETWYRILDLVGNGTISLEKIVSHVLPLEAVEKGFQLIKKGEAIKVVITP